MSKEQNKIQPDKYKIELKMANKLYEVEGGSVKSALDKIKPEKFTAKGYMRLRYGDKKVEKLMPTWFMRRLFSENEMYRVIMQKNLLMLLK
jgi:hypothetical protein